MLLGRAAPRFAPTFAPLPTTRGAFGAAQK